MPKVKLGGKTVHFPYTSAGKKAARAFTQKPMRKAGRKK